MKAMTLPRNWLGWFGGLVFAAAGFVVLMGFAHTEAGRPLLHLFAKAAGCPVDFEGGDPKVVEAYRIERLRERSGTSLALSAVALDFELGRSTRADVEQWARSVGAECNSAPGQFQSECRGETAHTVCQGGQIEEEACNGGACREATCDADDVYPAHGHTPARRGTSMNSPLCVPLMVKRPTT